MWVLWVLPFTLAATPVTILANAACYSIADGWSDITDCIAPYVTMQAYINRKVSPAWESEVATLAPNHYVKNNEGLKGIGVKITATEMLINSPPPNIMIGTSWSVVSLATASLMGSLNELQICFGSTNAKLSNKATYPFFMRTIPPDSLQSQALAAMIKHFGYTKVTCLYTTDGYAEGLALDVRNYAKVDGVTTSNYALPLGQMDTTWPDIMRSAMAEGNRIYVVVVLMGSVPAFWRIANELGMVGGNRENLIIAAETMAQQAISSDTSGTIGVVPISVGPLDKAFRDYWKTFKMADLPPWLFDLATAGGYTDEKFAKASMGLYTPFAADAMMASLHAMDKLAKGGTPGPDIRGELLKTTMYGLNFPGVTGVVSFNENGDRLSAYDIFNHVPDGNGAYVYSVSGIWSSAGGVKFTKDPIFPDGTTKIVPQHFPRCAAGTKGSGEPNCSPCEPGTYCPEGAPLACPPGAYCGRSSSFPQSCPVGTFNRREGAVSARSCMVCPMGTFGAREGLTECLGCSPGFFAEQTNSTKCGACPLGTYQSQPGNESCVACDQSQRLTTLMPGASLSTDCVCEPTTFSLDGGCVECGQGLECSGGNGLPVVEAGFYVKDFSKVNVFECKPANLCPGGGADSCLPGRTGVACGRCSEFHFTQWDKGNCVPCGPNRNSALFPLMVIVVLLGLSVLCVVLSKDPKSTALRTLSSGFVIGMGFSLIQVLQSFDSLLVHWRSPFSDLLVSTKLIAFQLDVLQGECFVGTFASTKYGPKVMMLPLVAGMYGSIVLLFIVVGPRVGLPRGNVAAFTNGIGTLGLVFFISLALVAAQPFDCVGHPGEDTTLHNFMEVVCGSAEHGGLVTFGALAVAELVLIFSCFLFAISRFRTWVLRNDHHMLLLTRFIFMRFKPDAYYFAIVILCRNVLLAFIPAIVPSEGLQIVMVAMILHVYDIVQTLTWPWRLPSLNALDRLLTITFLVILIVGGVYVRVRDSELDKQDMNMQVVMLGMISIAVGSMFVFVASQLVPRRKVYSVFISHQKSDSAATARWLQMTLAGHSGSSGKKRIFIDSDNLDNLDSLMQTVQSDVETLVVLLSHGVLWRPWCAGEICMALSSNVPVTICVFPGSEDVVESAAKNVRSLLPVQATEILQPFNLGYDDIEKLYRKLPECRSLTFDVTGPQQELLKSVRQLVVGGALSAGMSRITGGRTSSAWTDATGSREACDVTLILNSDSKEAISLSRIITYLLQDQQVVVYNTAEAPDEDALMVGAGGCVMVLLTAGVMTKPRVLAALITAMRQNKRIMPILAEGMGFDFPTEENLEELERSDCLAQAKNLTVFESDEAAWVWQKLLKIISPRITPHGGLDLLRAECSAIVAKCKKLSAHPSPPGSSNYNTRSKKNGGESWSTTAKTRTIGEPDNKSPRSDMITKLNQFSSLLPEDSNVFSKDAKQALSNGNTAPHDNREIVI